MKKTITILGVFMLIASGCNQATTSQANTSTKSALTTTENADSVEVQDVSENKALDSRLTQRCFSYLDGLHESEIQLFSIERIDSIAFFTTKNNTDIQRMEIERITDLERVKEILGDRVTWRASGGEISRSGRPMWEGFVTGFTSRNGKTHSLVYVHDCGIIFGGLWFVAYFPQFDVLVGEGGDMAVFHAIDLTTGAAVGSPSGYVFSPSKRFRLSSFDSGQDFDIYFIQEKIDGQYQTTIDLFCEFQKKLGEFLSWIDTCNSFWKNDTTLYIVRIVRWQDDEDPIKSHYRIILK